MKYSIFSITIGLLALLALSACLRKSAKVMKSPSPEWISSGAFIDYKIKDNVLTLNYEKLDARAIITEKGTVFIENSFSNNLAAYPSYAVVSPLLPGKSKVADNDDHILLSSGDIDLIISKAEFEVRIYKDDDLIHRFHVFKQKDKEKLILYSPAKKERFFGLGEKTGAFELSGRSFTMYNKDTYKYTKDTDPIYSAIPFYHVLGGDYQYSIFIDYPGKMALDLNNPAQQITIYDYYSRIYIFTGDTKQNLLSYSELTGKPFLPPLYGFGFHQSRYSYTNQQQIMQVARKFRDNDLPLDVLYLDIGFMSNHMSFTWDPRSFPDPKKMNQDLMAQGIRTVAIVDPGIKIEPRYDVYSDGLKKNVFVSYKGAPYKGAVWPGMCHFPDFSAPQTSAWWGQYYRRLLDLGISGFWNDMNEPSVFSGPNGTLPPQAMQDNMGYPREHKYIHNAYGLSMIKASYQEVQKLTPKKRVFLLTRSGYAGLQKYAMIWTGDNSASWEHLQMNLSMALNLGLSGVPYSGADIGGYSGSPQSELFTRWMQLATFIPFMRDHTEQGTRFQEPYVFENTLPVIRKYMRLRYKLLPYLYTQAYLAHSSGIPIVRPLWLEYGQDYLGITEEFLFGADLLIAPVLYPQKKKAKIEITLPHESGWVDWHTRKAAPSRMSLEPKIEDIPVFQRSGSIIPVFEKDYLSTQDINNDAVIILKVQPDVKGTATGQLYIDDYKTLDYKNEGFLFLTYEYQQSTNMAVLKINTKGKYLSKHKTVIELPSHITSLQINTKKYTVKDNTVSL